MVGNTDMRTAYGIKVERVEDVLAPPLRPRKVNIPGRHGSYDYGAHIYDERNLTIICATSQLLTRADARELSYTLSQKNAIRIWQEPDKIYYGRIYDPTAIEKLVQHLKKFSMTFICDPFASGTTYNRSFDGDRLTVNYAGSAETPTRMEIINIGTAVAAQLRIRVRERRNQ